MAPHANPAMPMKMPFGSKGFQNVEWPIPNLIIGNVPFFENLATGLMKKTFKNKKVMSIPEFRQICMDMGVNMIGCQMTMDVFGFKKGDFIESVDVGGAAAFLEFASEAEVQLFV